MDKIKTKLMKALDIDGETADALIAAGLTTPRRVKAAGPEKLGELAEADAGAAELVARMGFALEK